MEFLADFNKETERGGDVHVYTRGQFTTAGVTEKRELVSLLHRLKADGISVVLVEHDMAVDHFIVLDRGE